MSKNSLNRNKVFQNVNGNNILLTVNQYDSQNLSMEFIVKEINNKIVFKYFMLLFLLISINISLFYLKYIPSYYNFTLSILIVFLIIKIISTVTYERILLVKSLGIQVSLIYCTGSETSLFIPWMNIKKIFINEVITLQKVLFMLTIMVENEDGLTTLVPIFKTTRPRLNCLVLVYNQMNEIFR